MAFQRSYSKVWWGSDNELPSLPNSMNVGSSLTSGGYYYSSYHGQTASSQQHQTFDGSGYHSLDYKKMKMGSGNLSRIQEVDDEQPNSSKLSWEKHDSPGSLRSQDSGFSDNDESHSSRSLGERSSKTASPSNKSDTSHKSIDSPASTHTIATPPTVIRRVGRSEFYSPLVSVSRRISFNGTPTTAISGENENENVETNISSTVDDDVEDSMLLEQLDSIQLLNSTPKQLNDTDFHDNNDGDDNDAIKMVSTDIIRVKSKTKRRRRIVRTLTKPMNKPTKRRALPTSIEDNDEDDDYDVDCRNDIDDSFDEKNTHDIDGDYDDDDDDGECSFDELEQEISDLKQQQQQQQQQRPDVPEYNNETIYFGVGVPPQLYNNETVVFGGPLEEDTNNNTFKAEDASLSLFNRQHSQRTSTPKTTKQYFKSSRSLVANAPKMDFLIFEPFTTPALQHWVYELQSSCEQEVMSTLQTKSIAQEAFKNFTITTNTVAKLIRQLQQRAIYMQSDFERMERILNTNNEQTLHDALRSAEQLVANITEFTLVLERRAVFFSESRVERKRYEDNLDQIRLITKDTRYSIERQHYMNFGSLLDDVQVLKRYLLIALRQVFERMVHIIVRSIEQSRCDLMLRANINMVATLTNIDYEGFASLTDAFVQNEAVRALLFVCSEHKLSSVRALALRALATICCVPAAIVHLTACDGIEILRNILQAPTLDSVVKRGTAERREAVALLTQLTAAWHGPEHYVNGLKDCVESLVAGLTQLVGEATSCLQTLLLCAAALNNLSRMEVTSHYSIMSNETVFKLIETVAAKQQDKDEGITVFLYEQIVAMLHNMSLNKKCHSHLANGCIINFITSVYEMEFYKSYDSRAESNAQRRTIKAILHTLIRLIQDSNGIGLGLEILEQQRIPGVLFKLDTDHSRTTYDGCQQLGRDVELLVRQLSMAKKHAQQEQQQLQQQQQKLQQQQQQKVEQQQHQLSYSRQGSNERSVSGMIKAEEINGASTILTESGVKFNLMKHESFV